MLLEALSQSCILVGSAIHKAKPRDIDMVCRLADLPAVREAIKASGLEWRENQSGRIHVDHHPPIDIGA